MSETPHVPALAQLEDLADAAVDLAQQIRRTVAELRRQDTRGEDDA